MLSDLSPIYPHSLNLTRCVIHAEQEETYMGWGSLLKHLNANPLTFGKTSHLELRPALCCRRHVPASHSSVCIEHWQWLSPVDKQSAMKSKHLHQKHYETHMVCIVEVQHICQHPLQWKIIGMRVEYWLHCLSKCFISLMKAQTEIAVTGFNKCRILKFGL